MSSNNTVLDEVAFEAVVISAGCNLPDGVAVAKLIKMGVISVTKGTNSTPFTFKFYFVSFIDNIIEFARYRWGNEGGDICGSARLLVIA